MEFSHSQDILTSNGHSLLPNSILEFQTLIQTYLQRFVNSCNWKLVATFIYRFSSFQVSISKKVIEHIMRSHLFEPIYAPAINVTNIYIIGGSPRLSWWLGFVIILEKLIVTLGEINQKFLKIVKMYIIFQFSLI